MRFLVVLSSLVATALANGLTRPFYNASNILARSPNGDDYQYLDCYDQINQEGNSIRIGTTAVPDLRTYDFDNRIVSATFNGIYLLYEDRYFNSDTLDVRFIIILMFNWDLQPLSFINCLYGDE